MGGVGWGNNVHVTSRSSQGGMSQVEDSWTLCSAFRGDGWGGAITFMSRPVHLKLKTPGLYALHSGGDGWGGAITFMSRPVHLKLKAPGLCALHSGRGWVGWGGAITFMSRPVHLKLKTPGLYALHSGGDGWGGAITFMSRPVHLKLKTPGLYVRLHTVELNKLFAFQILLLGIYYLMALGLRPPIFVFRAQAVERTLSECKSISAEYRASQENRRRIIETTGTA